MLIRLKRGFRVRIYDTCEGEHKTEQACKDAFLIETGYHAEQCVVYRFEKTEPMDLSKFVNYGTV